MAVFVPDFSLEGLNEAQTLEVLQALQHIYNTPGELQVAINQGIEQYANYDVWTTPQGHTFINTGTRLAGEYYGPVASASETALEMAEEAWEGYNAAVIDASGNVIYRYNNAQGAMGAASGASNAGQAASLLSLDVGMVGAAVAPLLGVSLGVGLYESNPEFWTKLSQKLLPFCYEGTTQIPGWLDIVESALHPGEYETHAVIDKRIVEAVEELLEEYKERDLPDYATSGTYVFSKNFPFQAGLAYCLSQMPDGVEISDNVLSALNSKIAQYPNSPYTIYVYIGHGPFQGHSVLTLRVFRNISPNDTVSLGSSQIADEITTGGVKSTATSPMQITSYRTNNWVSRQLFVGEEKNVPNKSFNFSSFNGYERIDYPEGTSEWEGYTPSLSPYSRKIMYFKRDPLNPDVWISDPQDGIEITVQPKDKDIPSGQPYPSADPADEPDPNRTSKPKSALSNLDNSAPGTETNPAQEPQPDPETNPSQPTTPPNPVIPVDPPGTPGIDPPPPDSGTSPTSLIPYVPLPFSTANDGLISVYHPTDAQLKAFASWLWVTYADPSIDKLWNNPFDGVIGLMEIYCTPTDSGTKTIRSGFLDSGISSAIITRYTEINCGTVFVPEYYRNYFDYSPYSKCHIYLPFVGIVELNVDDIVGHGVNVTYKIDEYNGSCIAQITVAKYTEVNGEPVEYSDLMYQFSGNCAVELPLAGGTQSAIRAGMIQAAAYGLSSAIGGIVSGAAGNIGGAISGLASGAAGAVSSLVSAKSSVQHSGSFGSSFGALGCKIPFITITRPKQLAVYNYPDLYGYPAHCAVTIGACTGFLRVREVNVRSATASDEEKIKIEEMLKAGVYV